MKRRLKELDLPTQRSCCCTEPNPHIAYCTGARWTHLVCLLCVQTLAYTAQSSTLYFTA